MSEDDLRTMLREFRASVAADLEAADRRMRDFVDEMRERIGTAETAILNEIRAMDRRVDRRLERVEERLAALEDT